MLVGVYVAKTKINLPSDWNIDEFVLAKSLSKDAKVLFIYAQNYNTIEKMVDTLNIEPIILNDDFEELERARKFGFKVVSGNINSGVLDNFSNKEFDYVVCEVGLNSARYLSDFLKSVVRICSDFVLCQKNDGRFSKRLKFLFRGSLYVKNQYDVIPDDNFAWFNRDPWCLSHKDIVNLCACCGFIIKRGTIIYKNNDIDNMYDIRSYPNLSALKIYYTISNESTIKPTYKLGGSAL